MASKLGHPAALSYAQSAQAGINCEGPLGDRIKDDHIAFRVFQQIGYDALFGEEVEAIMYPAAQSWADWWSELVGMRGNVLDHTRNGIRFNSDSGTLK